MKMFTFFIFFALAQGCVHHEIYLATQHGTPEQISMLEKELKFRKHTVSQVDISLGTDNDVPVILYPPTLQNSKILNDLEDSLKAIGYVRIELMSFNLYNHIYTKENIGIYLPYSTIPKLPDVMQSEDCGGKYAIIESTKNSVKIEVDVLDGTYEEIQGSLEFLGKTHGLITTEKMNINFSLQETIRNTYKGEKPARLLTLVSDVKHILPKKCTFIVIYE